VSSEFETKVLPCAGVAFVIVAVIGFVFYLTLSQEAATIGLVAGAVFLVLGIACLGAWAWIRMGKKIGEGKQRVMR
jgi:protein-S-isoprenylcysteine O-methyltransferase Ste14